jgi:hypothetical protein
MYRLTIRATDDEVAPIILKLMETRLSQGYNQELDDDEGIN